MRILTVHNRYQNRGGEDECFDTEAALLRQHGHEVREYIQDNAALADCSASASFRSGLRAVWNPQEYKAIRRLVREYRPDVIHVHNFFPLISPAVHYAASAERTPVVQTLHNYRLLCPAALMFREGQACDQCIGKLVPWPGVRFACYRGSRAATGAVAAMSAVHRFLGTWRRKTTFFITPSDFARRQFMEAGFPARKLLIKPNCLYPDPCPRAGNRSYAAFVGRLAPGKGVSTLLSAWKQLPSRIPLKVVGDGPLAGEAAAAAQQLPNLEWLGRRSLRETYDIMAGALFLVVPSESYETFGRVVIEAFAHATPVIVSHLGAAGELVIPGRTGLHFSAGNVADLAAQVAWAYAHPQLLAQMGHNARLAYESNYTAVRNYAVLMEIYDKAIGHASKTASQPSPGTPGSAAERRIVCAGP